MESCPTQARLPLVGLAAEKVIRDRYIRFKASWFEMPHGVGADGRNHRHRR
ncbi:MAG: hypothetical protein ACQESR_25415 [Planctomycetota bacterium]